MAAWAAWHTAYLPRAKRPVKLRDMMVGKARQQSAEEQLSIAYAWTAAVQRINGEGGA